MSLPALSISLLGGFALRVGTERVPIESARIRALLAHLALHLGGPQSRAGIASALWPESTDAQARTNLRNLLHQLRRALPVIDRYLETTASSLQWRIDAPIEVDVLAFEEALSAARDRADDEDALETFEAALSLYGGPLLPDALEPWLSEHQARLARMYEAGLEALLERRLEHGHFAAGLEVADRILGHDPLNERAHRARIVGRTELGDRAGAVRAYHECEASLSAELGVAPSRATRAAYEAALGTTGAAGSGSSAGIIEAEARPPRDSALVGRSAERAMLQRMWTDLAARGTRIAWITGEPGIGKTRLAQSIAEWIERQGHVVAHARAYPTQGAHAYGPVVAWLRSPALAPAIAAAATAVRAELARLLPELEEVRAHEPELETEAERRRRIHDAVLAVLDHPAAPSAYIVDDLHWCDRETVGLVQTLTLRSRRPLLLLATLRSGEVVPEDAAWLVGTRLAEAGLLERIELEPLDASETARLARQLSGIAPTEAQSEALYRETEGNPLFIVETVRSGTEWLDRPNAPTATAPRIRAVIEARLAPLSPEGRAVTRVAATLGRGFTLPLLLRVSPLDEGATLRGLDEAWRRRLVRERDDGGYDFTHDRIREVAYRTTSPIHRRGQHRRIAQELETAWDEGAAGPDITPDQIAQHYDRGGSPADAVRWYRRAADLGARVSGLDAARQLLERALELLVRLRESDERRAAELEMSLALGSILVALEGYGRPGIVRIYRRAAALCRELDRPVPPPVLRALGLAALARGDLEEGVRCADGIVRSAAGSGDAAARVEGEYLAGVMAFWGGDLAAAERRLAQAIAWYRPERHREHIRLYAQDPKVVCLSRLAWTLWHRGRVAKAFELRDEALRTAELQNDPHGRAYALWFTMFLAIDTADVRAVDTQALQLKHLATTHQLHYMDAVAEGFLGYAATLCGDPRGGIARMRATLDDARWHDMDYVLRPQTLLLIALASAAEGEATGARAAVKEALDFLGPGAAIWKAPLQVVDARAAGRVDRAGGDALPAFERALATARAYDSAWCSLRAALDRASWCIERGRGDRRSARDDLSAALACYADAPALPVVAAARVLIERLEEENP